MKFKHLLKWFGIGKKEVSKPVVKLKVPGKRVRYVKDKWGNKRQVVEVKTPRKIAKHITVLAEELKKRKEAS